MKYFLFIFFVSSTALAVDLGDCSNQIGFDVGVNAASVGDFTGQYPFKIENNRLRPNNPAAIVNQEVSAEKETYKYRVGLTKDISEVRTLEVTRDGSDFTLVRKDDLAAQEKFSKKMGYFDKAYTNLPARAGLEMHYSAENGKCLVTQGMTLMKLKGKDFYKEIYVDRKYCERIEGLVKSEGKEQIQGCVSILEKANKLYEERVLELGKENKAFSRFETGFMGNAMKIAMCSPKEFEIRLEYLRGFGMNMTYDNPYGMGIAGPAAKTGNPSAK